MNTFVLPLLTGAPDAASGAGTTASLISTFVPFGLVILIFYFLIIRPQNKKQKETEKMLAALKKGDKVVTIGGIHGVIQSVKESTVVVKVDDSTKIEFSRSAIASVLESAKSEKAVSEITEEAKGDH
ncbi:MAG: preprotein translocase subunit YajC [Termitinemataceae bacterium]